MPIVLYDKETNRRLFEITRAQLEQLIDALEEESTDDRDYYFDAAVCDFLDGRVDAELLARLRALLPAGGASGESDGVAAAGAEEALPPIDDDDDEGAGIEILWREE